MTKKQKVILLSNKIIDGNTSSDELENILLENRGVKKDFLKNVDINEIGASDFGVDKEEFKKAVSIINLVTKEQNKILIYGDYDVDGITSTSILWKTIFPKNKNIKPIIPDREKDGYGLNVDTVENYCSENNFLPELLILVDNGIVAQRQIKKLKKKINKVIIIDHHQKNDKKNEADSIIHSSKTSASVLAYLLSRQINHKADLGLACLGLIADMADLSNVYNRNVAIAGIKELNKRKNIGIDKLLDKSGWGNKVIDEWTIGFVIGPRVNAAGRMGNATRALRLLSFDDEKLAEKLADELESENRKRQEEERQILKGVLVKDWGNDEVIVELGDFNPGIIGLVSGKLAEKYKKPAIVVSSALGDVLKGSARSVGDFDITKFLRKNDRMFESLGGHSGAAGFSIKKENWKKWLLKIKDQKIGKFENIGLICEAKMSLKALTMKNLSIIEKFSPFGQANKKPVFLFENMRVVECRGVGKDGSHLKLKIDDITTKALERVVIDGIAFGKNGFLKDLDKGSLINLAASLNLNEYGGKRRVELMVKEIWF